MCSHSTIVLYVIFMVGPKDKRGIPGSRERGIHYLAATGALDPIFGAARHFVPTNREEEPGKQYHNIEEMYVRNLNTLKVVRKGCLKYYMVDTLQVPTMIDMVPTNPSLRWGGETTKRDMLVHWYYINLAETIEFQSNKNSFASEEDMPSIDLVKDLFTKPREAELKQQVDDKFDKLDPLEQGGITHLKFFLDEIFCMTNEVVTALQALLKNFAEEGLSKKVGENVSGTTAQIKTVSERLSEVNQPTLEATTYVLQGLTNCSVPEFTGPFELMPNQGPFTQMATPVSLVNTSSNTLKRVLNIIHLANISHHSLNTSNY